MKSLLPDDNGEITVMAQDRALASHKQLALGGQTVSSARQVLPAREHMTKAGETHLMCPGEGCKERLGKVHSSNDSVLYITSGSETISRIEIDASRRVTLEAGYTNEPHKRYPLGYWWKKETGHFKGMKHGTDVRRRVRQGDPPHAWPIGLPKPAGLKMGPLPPELQAEVDAHTVLRGEQKAPRETLWAGRYYVVCCKCEGHAWFDV